MKKKVEQNLMQPVRIPAIFEKTGLQNYFHY
jgi:hypothetical protein